MLIIKQDIYNENIYHQDTQPSMGMTPIYASHVYLQLHNYQSSITKNLPKEQMIQGIFKNP